jgi:nitrate/nitrite-specific signal transduction histidine kinase
MLRHKLMVRIGLLVTAFVCGAVVAICLLQDALADIEHNNRDAIVLIDGIQTITAAAAEIQTAREVPADDSSARIADATRRLKQAAASISAHPVAMPGGSAAGSYTELARALPAFLDHDPSGRAEALAVQTAAQSLGRVLREHVGEEQAALGRYFRALVLALTIAALVMVNVAIVVLLRTARVVLAPVEALVEGSRELAAERFDHRVRVDQHDEFGELALAYNSLAAQLQANEERKAETLRQLAVTLNHDLNNSMAVIELQLGQLDRQTGGNPALAGHLREIRSYLGRMSRMVASLKNIRRVVLTDYAPGQKMLDLERSVVPIPPPVHSEHAA